MCQPSTGYLQRGNVDHIFQYCRSRAGSQGPSAMSTLREANNNPVVFTVRPLKAEIVNNGEDQICLNETSLLQLYAVESNRHPEISTASRVISPWVIAEVSSETSKRISLGHSGPASAEALEACDGGDLWRCRWTQRGHSGSSPMRWASPRTGAGIR